MLKNTLIRIKSIGNKFHNMPKKPKSKATKGSSSSTKNASTVKPVSSFMRITSVNIILKKSGKIQTFTKLKPTHLVTC